MVRYTSFVHARDVHINQSPTLDPPKRADLATWPQGFEIWMNPLGPPAREGLGSFFLARSRSPLRPSPAHRRALERRVQMLFFATVCRFWLSLKKLIKTMVFFVQSYVKRITERGSQQTTLEEKYIGEHEGNNPPFPRMSMGGRRAQRRAGPR